MEKKNRDDLFVVCEKYFTIGLRIKNQMNGKFYLVQGLTKKHEATVHPDKPEVGYEVLLNTKEEESGDIKIFQSGDIALAFRFPPTVV